MIFKRLKDLKNSICNWTVALCTSRLYFFTFPTSVVFLPTYTCLKENKHRKIALVTVNASSPYMPNPTSEFQELTLWSITQYFFVFFNAARSPKYNLFKPWWSIWRLHTLLILATPSWEWKIVLEFRNKMFWAATISRACPLEMTCKVFYYSVPFNKKKHSSNLYNSDSYKNGTLVLQFQSWNTCSTCRLIVLGTFTIILAFRYSPQISSILLEETGWQCSLTLHV